MDSGNELVSSPDPLAGSEENLGASSPCKKSYEQLKLTPKKPLADTSSSARFQRLYITTPLASEKCNASPLRLIAEADNPASPWRIRVTVEAQQEGKGKSANLWNAPPKSRLAERTVTTTVPLKDGDGQSSKKMRGRPRKSLDTPLKRSGTLKPKPVGSAEKKITSVNIGAKDDSCQSSTPGRRKAGRPRKSLERFTEGSEAQTEDKAQRASMHQTNNKISLEKTGAKCTRSSGKRKAVVPEKVDLHSAPSLESTRHVRERQMGKDYLEGIADCMNAQADPHFGSPDPTGDHAEYDSILESEGFSMVSVSSLPSAKLHSSSALQHTLNGEDTMSNKGGVLSSSILSLDSSTLDIRNDLQQHHQNLQTIASSDSSSSMALQQLPVTQSHNTPFIISTTNSVPPLARPLAPPPSSRQLEEATDGTPKIDRVVRAGVALQGALSPSSGSSKARDGALQEYSNSSASTAEVSKQDTKDLFSGFGAGTRRELRAGLRLGEELAKKEEYLEQLRRVNSKSEDDVFSLESLSTRPKSSVNSGYSLKLPRTDSTPLYPLLSNSQLPSPERSEEEDCDDDRMSWKYDTLRNTEITAIQSGRLSRNNEASVGVASNFEGSTMAREEEEYRLERVAVSRQIEMANSSQVIVIHSDSENDECESDDDEGNDIWQEQAHSSDVVFKQETESSFQLFQTQVYKPRRSQIPSPWRRHNPINTATQKVTNDTDLFWQPSLMVNSTATGKETLNDVDCMDSVPQSSSETSIVQDDDVNGSSRSLCGQETILSSPDQGCKHVLQKINTGICQENVLLPDGLNDEDNEIWEPSIHETVDSQEYTPQEFTNEIDSSFTQASSEAVTLEKTVDLVSITNKIEAVSCANLVDIESSTKKTELIILQPTPATSTSSASWFGYLASFIPIRRDAPSAAPAAATSFRLPNGKTKLFRSGCSEGPLCLYTPWTDDHYDALYFHYAAWKEGRRRYKFNPKSPSAPFVGEVIRWKGWEKPVTKEEVAVVDEFMIDLGRRGHAERAKGERLIDDKMVRFYLFKLWRGGVLRGECEVGIGKTGWAENGKEMWRPEMEDWYQGNQ